MIQKQWCFLAYSAVFHGPFKGDFLTFTTRSQTGSCIERVCANLLTGWYTAGVEVCPAFIDETGLLNGPAYMQPVYGVGVLVLPDPPRITELAYRRHFNFVSTRSAERSRLISEIRTGERTPTLEELNLLLRNTRHHEYKFSEVTKGNLQQYIDLLSVYFAQPGCEFHALILDRLDPRFSLGFWNHDPWRAYVGLTTELVKRRITRSVFPIVDLQGQPSSADTAIEDALCTIPNVKGCLRASSETSVFLQIVDVLLGCLQCDWNDAYERYEVGSGRAEAKRQLTRFIKAHFGIPAAEPILTSTMTYRRRQRTSLFTASLWREPRHRDKEKRAAMARATPANGTR